MTAIAGEMIDAVAFLIMLLLFLWMSDKNKAIDVAVNNYNFCEYGTIIGAFKINLIYGKIY